MSCIGTIPWKNFLLLFYNVSVLRIHKIASFPHSSAYLNHLKKWTWFILLFPSVLAICFFPMNLFYFTWTDILYNNLINTNLVPVKGQNTKPQAIKGCQSPSALCNNDHIYNHAFNFYFNIYTFNIYAILISLNRMKQYGSSVSQ